MQRAWFNRRRIVLFIIIPILILSVLIALDQITKYIFRENLSTEKITVIENFFYFRYVVNTGSAFSFLAGKSWAQTFFKILTPIALLGFSFVYYFACKNDKKWLAIAMVFVIGGTVGNFIDRLLFNGVTDFLSFKFGDYTFPTFNFADAFLTVGVTMVIIYLLFLDKNAIFKKNEK